MVCKDKSVRYAIMFAFFHTSPQTRWETELHWSCCGKPTRWWDGSSGGMVTSFFLVEFRALRAWTSRCMSKGCMGGGVQECLLLTQLFYWHESGISMTLHFFFLRVPLRLFTSGPCYPIASMKRQCSKWTMWLVDPGERAVTVFGDF